MPLVVSTASCLNIYIIYVGYVESIIVAISCPPLDVALGQVNVSNNTQLVVGVFVNITCDPGYSLTTGPYLSTTIECMKNGHWSSNITSCIRMYIDKQRIYFVNHDSMIFLVYRLKSSSSLNNGSWVIKSK